MVYLWDMQFLQKILPNSTDHVDKYLLLCHHWEWEMMNSNDNNDLVKQLRINKLLSQGKTKQAE